MPDGWSAAGVAAQWPQVPEDVGGVTEPGPASSPASDTPMPNLARSALHSAAQAAVGDAAGHESGPRNADKRSTGENDAPSSDAATSTSLWRTHT
jgi:hypothetical protein